MSMKSFLLLTVTLLIACPDIAHGGWGAIRHGRVCSTPSVVPGPSVNACPPGAVPIGAVNVVPPLEPIVIQETYTVEVPVRETVTGPDGEPRIVTRKRQETRTRTRVLRTANEQIEYLKDRLVQLDRQRVAPLEDRVDRIEGQ